LWKLQLLWLLSEQSIEATRALGRAIAEFNDWMNSERSECFLKNQLNGVTAVSKRW